MSAGPLAVDGGTAFVANDAVYVGSDLTLTNGAYVETTSPSAHKDIVVMGDFSMSGGTSIVADDQVPFILTSGNFTLSNGAYAYAGVYAPNADVTITGNARLYGAIIANSASLGNSAQVVYLPGLVGPGSLFATGDGGALVMKSWHSSKS
jgi:hypothetical protein